MDNYSLETKHALYLISAFLPCILLLLPIHLIAGFGGTLVTLGIYFIGFKLVSKRLERIRLANKALQEGANVSTAK